VDGILVFVDFKHLKGHRNPHTRLSPFSNKEFTFIPTRGNRYEFDVSALMIVIAFEHGLFPFKTLEALHADRHVKVPVNAAVANQAVFVSANQDNGLDVTRAMKTDALNTKLHQVCTDVGILARNTMYSFRRSAIIDTSRKFGQDAARALAGHSAGSNSYFFYDTDLTRTCDIGAERIGEMPIDRADVRDFLKRFQAPRVDSEAKDYQSDLHDRVIAAMRADPNMSRSNKICWKCCKQSRLLCRYRNQSTVTMTGPTCRHIAKH
jgi:hypothetical protein